MNSSRMLTQNLLLSDHRTYGKKSHIHETTQYRFSDHTVVHVYRSVRRRLWGLLPPKVTKERRVLQIPDEITTEEQLLRFVRSGHRHWLR